MNVDFVVQARSGISYHRLINPMEFMPWSDTDSANMLWIIEDEHKIDGDILYYSKFIFTEPEQIRKLQQRGIKIVVDIDDSWDLPLNHYYYNDWTSRNNGQRVIDNIKLADLVICTTMRLQDKVRQYNKNTVVIPNALPFGYENYLPKPQEHQGTTFMYAAGSSHLADVELLRGKFKRIGSDPFIKDNAEFVLAGYEPTAKQVYATKEDQQSGTPTTIYTHGIWEKMASVFSQTGSSRVLPSANLDDYINYYDQADIALIPLVANDWNSYKSELKIVEAGCKAVPVICSKVLPYSELYGKEGIMWVESPNQWIEHIRYCIKNPEYVKDMGQKLHEWVIKEYDLLEWNKVRYELFKSLLK